LIRVIRVPVSKKSKTVHERIDFLFVYPLQPGCVLQDNPHLPGVKFIGIGVPEKMPERPQIIQQNKAFMRQQGGPDAVDGNRHSLKKLRMILALVLYMVLESSGDYPE
jgi:hypothetical protein